MNEAQRPERNDAKRDGPVLSQMTSNEIAAFAHEMQFEPVDHPPEYVEDRLGVLTSDKHPDDRVSWHVMTLVPLTALERSEETRSIKLYVAQQVNKDGVLEAVHFIEDSGELSGFSQIFIGDGKNGIPVGQPYIFWNHTDHGFTGQGRGLLRTIAMGEYVKKKLKKYLDAGKMADPTSSTRQVKKKDGSLKDMYMHAIHIWERLVVAKLAEKVGENKYRYIASNI